jgi:hypothetical protein
LGPDAKPVTIERLKEELEAAVAKDPDLKLDISTDKKLIKIRFLPARSY